MFYSRSSSSTNAESNASFAIWRSITLFAVARDDSSSRSKRYEVACCDRFARAAPSSSMMAQPVRSPSRKAGLIASNLYWLVRIFPQVA
jgi:hypothetical protein